MHHEQDIRKMGGLRKKLPITYITSVIGTLALIGFPAFAGFFSKESIIEAVHLSHLPGASYAYYLVLAGVFFTTFYSMRLLILVFHGKPRMTDKQYAHVHESSPVVTMPLIALAICSVLAGFLIEPMIYGGFFDKALFLLHEHNVMAHMASEFHGALAMLIHGFFTWPFALLVAGIAVAYLFYVLMPSIPESLANKLSVPRNVLVHKYGFDWLYIKGFARVGVGLGDKLSAIFDRIVIDGLVVNGTANLVRVCAGRARKVQSGFLYQYAFAMILGLLVLLTYFYLRH
jgi:NADH-quinone oxidoreductase subunit L